MTANRSHKPKRRIPQPVRNSGGVIIGIFIGLMLGALLAAWAAWYLTRSSSLPLQQVVTPPNTQTSVRPGNTAGTKNEFEFYRILPQGQESGAGGAAVQTPAARGTAPSGTATPDTTQTASIAGNPAALPGVPQRDRFYLQVGAFQNPAEAENMKALLALNGIDASAQQAKLDDGRTVHRVRIGPFDSTEEMRPVRSRLTAAGLTASMIRVKQ